MYLLLRIISNFRGIKTEDQEESERLFKLVDVIKDDKEVDAKTKNTEKLDTTEPADQITCNGVPLVKLAEEEYVYDVYTMQSDAMSSTGIIKVYLFWEGRKNMNKFEDTSELFHFKKGPYHLAPRFRDPGRFSGFIWDRQLKFELIQTTLI